MGQKRAEKTKRSVLGARVSRRGGGSRLAGFVPSAVWPPCARVTVAMERLAATGRTEARSAEAPRAVLDPAA
mgnify:CR=1 FL=1